MKIKTMFLGLLIMSLAPATQAFGQGQDEDVRGAFLTTRQKPAQNSGKSVTTDPQRRHRPKTVETKPSTSMDNSSTTATKVGETPRNKTPGQVASQKIGLGLTLFARDSNGLAARVDPSREFRKGDRVRLLLETNTAGHLYIFNTTNGGQPVMIYPDPALDNGGNFIQAHEPVELPSSLASQERLRWLTFDEHAGAEKLYLVLTREPLPGVPIEDDLVTYCREKTTNCPIHPRPELWAQIQKELNAPVKIAKAQTFGGAETNVERDATTRGIGLSKEDPAPSVITLTASSSTSTLVTTVDLIHK